MDSEGSQEQNLCIWVYYSFFFCVWVMVDFFSHKPLMVG